MFFKTFYFYGVLPHVLFFQRKNLCDMYRSAWPSMILVGIQELRFRLLDCFFFLNFHMTWFKLLDNSWFNCLYIFLGYFCWLSYVMIVFARQFVLSMGRQFQSPNLCFFLHEEAISLLHLCFFLKEESIFVLLTRCYHMGMKIWDEK